MTGADLPPVLIAGGGPVGLATALLLARFGVPTIVLEALTQPEPVGSKSICVQRDVLDIYHRIGAADALLAAGVTWNVARTFYREHELFEVTFPAPGRSHYPGWINVAQSNVERVLAGRVAGEALIDLRYGWQVVAVRQDDAGVTVRAQTPTGPVDLTATHLVAADGSRSVVRNLLWLDFTGHSFGDLFLIADIRADLPFGDERRFHFDPAWNPGRQVLVHPQPDSVWRIDWQVPASYDLTADQASGGLDRRIRQITGGTQYEIVWLSVYRFHQRIASRFVVDRVLLAGDAAHLMSPFGARGLNSGIQDAENAAWKIAYDRRGSAGAGLLASYHDERFAAALENLRVTGDTMCFLVPRNEAEWSRRREVLDRAVTDPAARPLVNSGKLAEPFWYLDSPLTTPGDVGAGGAGGFPREPGAARPPVPGVLCPDGPVLVAERPEVTRLRELFGTGFVLLRTDDELAGAADVHDVADLGHDLAGTTGSTVDVFDLAAIDVDGVLRPALAARPGRVWLVRPDGHLAAVLDNLPLDAVRDAVLRACGHPVASSTSA